MATFFACYVDSSGAHLTSPVACRASSWQEAQGTLRDLLSEGKSPYSTIAMWLETDGVKRVLRA